MSAIGSSTSRPISSPLNAFQARKLNESAIKSEKNDPTELSKDEEREVSNLRRRDAEVRAHELAHKATAGRFASGGANFELERGPDGKFYAVGGHVNLDISEETDPARTIDKMRTIRRAALAPSEPSAQYRAVASKASAIEAKARKEKIQVKVESNSNEEGKSVTSIGNGNNVGKSKGFPSSFSSANSQQAFEFAVVKQGGEFLDVYA